MWTVERFRRERQAGELAAALGVAGGPVGEFDGALAAWLDSFGEVMSLVPRDMSYLPGRPETDVDEDIAQALDSLTTVEALYAWARLVKAQDALWGFDFGWGVTGPLMRHHLAAATPTQIDVDQAAAVIRYMTPNMSDSPNSGAYDTLWDLARNGGLFGISDMRQEVLALLLGVVERRGYHHKLTDLRQILKATCDEDEAVHRRLRTFSPDNHQGAALIAGEVMRTIPVASAASACRAADVLAWLVDARRKEPTPRWRERLTELEATLDSDTLQAICAEVARHPEYARHKGTGWRDELFWFMWKTSAWYFGDTPQRILN